MTQVEGTTMRLDEWTEAIYLMGNGASATAPGWYLRERHLGERRLRPGGPYASSDEARRVWQGERVASVRESAPPIITLPTATPYVLKSTGSSRPTQADGATHGPGALCATVSPADGTEAVWQALHRRLQAALADVSGYRHLLGYTRTRVEDDDDARGISVPAATKLTVLASEHLWTADHVRIDDFVKLEAGGGLIIGARVHIASFCHLGIGGGITILDDDSSYGSGAKVISGSSVQTPEVGCSPLSPGVRIDRSFAWVKRHATMYANSVLLPGCVLGEGSVLAAGAVLKAGTVTGDHELWAGVPAVCKGRIR